MFRKEIVPPLPDPGSLCSFLEALAPVRFEDISSWMEGASADKCPFDMVTLA